MDQSPAKPHDDDPLIVYPVRHFRTPQPITFTYSSAAVTTRTSVIIPAYNRKVHVQEAIDSVLAQTFADHEIIVVDDGSTDGTGDVLRERYGDCIRYLWQENQGESVARNRGIELSRGRYIALLDSDDLWLPEKLEKQVEILDSQPAAVLVFSPAWFIAANGVRLRNAPVGIVKNQDDLTLESLCLGNRMGPAGSTALIRRQALEQVGGFDPTLRLSEDWDLWIRLRQIGPFEVNDEPLACIRQSEDSQWHHPKPETVDIRLASHLRILEKAFSTWQGKIPKGLRAQAVARQYKIAAFRYYFIGRSELAQQKVNHAAKLDPGILDGRTDFIETLLGEFLTPRYVSTRSLQNTVKVAEKAFRYLPADLTASKAQLRIALAELYSQCMFDSFERRDLQAVRYCWPRAVMHDTSLLRNRGVWSIGINAFLGSGVADRLRREGHEARITPEPVIGPGGLPKANMVDETRTNS